MPPERVHWLVEVVERAARAPLQSVALGGATVAAAWSAVAEASGLTPAELANLVARHFRLEVADLSATQSRAIRLIPDGLARRHLVLPLRETDRELVLATADPTNLEAEQELGFVSGRKPVFAVAPPEQLETAIGTWYAPNRLVASLVESVADDAANMVQVMQDGPAEQVTEEDVESEPVIKLTNVILRDAITQRASDIHFEPGKEGASVRFRVDGVLRRHMQLPPPALTRVLSRIKVLGRLDIADRLRPQDGRARILVEGRQYDLRISTVPTRDAEKAVIRVLNTRQTAGLGECGLPAPELERLRQVLAQRDGIVVVTGPTGSGKTTTLYSAIRELATEEVNVMTVEDPVEYELPGITQIQVEPRRGVTFASALRAILRQDPDVILIGEIRDLETAEVAVQAAMTGHLVLATLHTNDAVGVIQRLVDLGLDRPSIAESLRATLAQRLVRRLCPACARPANGRLPESEARLAERSGVTPPMALVGCADCGHTGYRGRLPVVELLTADRRLRDLVVAGKAASELVDAARAAGMRPLEEVALEPVRAGLTTLTEVARELGEPMAQAGGGRDDEATTILLVDDDAVNRTLARTLLQKQGYRVVEAVDGVEALERLERERFELMVLDLDMPRLDGRQVLRRVRGAVLTAGLPVVVLTGTHDESAEAEMMDAGADDYVRKPIDAPRFAARIRAALRRRAA
jgi:type II secretory ATPase GspE/PulE/Tfp pilus assembly ATPase PilB-like protein/CheY-like chemotaxis protein